MLGTTLFVSFLALASASSSFPQPHMARNLALSHGPHQRAAISRRRTLPRQGRRLEARDGQATVKCLSRYTFALCDGDNCTDMGSVAAGTACIDGAIDWDTNPPAASAKQATTTSVVAVAASTTSDAATTTTSAAATATTSAASINDSGKNAANLGVQIKSSATTMSATYASAATSSASATADDSDGGEDDCSEEDDNSTETNDSTSSYVAPTTSAASSSSSTVADVNAAVQLTTPAAQTTTTSSAPAASSTSSSSSGSSEVFTGGFATFFYQYGAYGACGQIHADSDKIVAIQIDRYGTGSNNAPDCGRTVVITNTDNGKTVTATVADACPGCKNQNSLDLSTGAFDAIADESSGIVPISWYFSS